MTRFLRIASTILILGLPSTDVHAQAGAPSPEQTAFLESTCGPAGEASWTFGGSVLDLLTQSALSGVAVTVEAVTWVGEQPTRIALTNVSGRYAFCNLPWSGRMRVRAVVGSQQDPGDIVELANGMSWIAPRYVQVSEPSTLAGRIVDASDAPVAGVRLRAEGLGVAARTSDDGSFRLRNIPAGTLVIEFSHPDYTPRTDTLEVEGGFGIQLTVTMSRQAVVTLPPIRVAVAPRERSSPLEDASRASFRGLTEVQVDALLPRVQTMGDLLRQALIPGLVVSSLADGSVCFQVVRRGTTACSHVPVFVDEVRQSSPGLVLANFDPNRVRRVQFVSRLDARLQYGESDAGVLLITTR